MPQHIVYLEILSHINRALCAHLSRDEVKHQVIQLITDLDTRHNLSMPSWEQQQLALQLVHALPCREHARH
jgi:hypothetical protein